MTHIIDPHWFYWLHVLDVISVCTFVSLILCSATLIICALFAILSYGWGYKGGENDSDWLVYLKFKSVILKILIPMITISLLLNMFVPSKEALIEMQIARLATYENAEWTLDTVKAAVDYIVESIKSVR